MERETCCSPCPALEKHISTGVRQSAHWASRRLTASEEVIFERISRNKKRPLLQTGNPRETVRELLAQRRASYETAAQFTLDNSALPHAGAADAVIAEARRAFSWQPAA